MTRTAITWFYLILAAAGVGAFVLPRWSAYLGDTGLIQFQFISMATIAFISLCALAEAAHTLSDVLSLLGGLTIFSLLNSADCGRILWQSHRNTKILKSRV